MSNDDRPKVVLPPWFWIAWGVTAMLIVAAVGHWTDWF